MSASASGPLPDRARTDPVRPDPARVEELFHRAAELSAGEQAGFLAAECGDDAALLRAVTALLACDRESGARWKFSAMELEAQRLAGDASPARSGDSFGPYRIVRRIAVGGMSVVFEALRDDPEFQKRVAIKVVQRGPADGGSLAAQFRDERQILAQLEHPYIARLLDGGTTADGLPYLVMEYVDGIPIDRFAREHGLSRDGRLQLFVKACEAVQYAHRNLVIHRDLKPGNILVAADGMPKLLDFGIAKLMTGAAQGNATTILALTPEYASPEQMEGRSITTASDVYSLGVLLFVLLADRLPYDSATAQPAALLKAICEDEPVWRPAGLIDADLKSVLAQALRKEPERRYVSVEHFADDVRRYLAGLPVTARPNTLAYRARKFARRRAVSLAIAGALVAAVAMGVATSLWEARRAERERLLAQRRFDQARRLAYTVIHDIQPKLAAINGTVGLRKTLIEQTLVYLEALSRDAGDSPALMRELLDAYRALAEVAADPGTANVGDHQRAAQILQEGQKVAAALERADAASVASVQILVQFYSTAAHHYFHYGSQQEAVALAERGIKVAERLAATHPENIESLNQVALAGIALADSIGNATADSEQDRRRKIDLYEHSRKIWRDIARRKGRGDAQKRIASVDKSLSSVLADQGNYQRALEYAVEARALDEEGLKENPDSPAAQMSLAFDIGSVGYIYLQLRDYPKAVDTMRQNVALREKVVESNPDDRRAADRLAYALRDLANAEELGGDRGGARRDLYRTLKIYERLAAGGPLVPQSLGRYALGLYTASEMERKRGNTADACVSVRKSAALLDEYQRRTHVEASSPEEVTRIRAVAGACKQ